MSGWIKLHRNLADWEWYDDHNTTRLFIHCLIKANFEPKNWRGISIDRGQFWTSIPSLEAETGLSKSQIRTSFNKLKLTGEVTVKSQAQGRMVTVSQYDQYQADDRPIDRPVADQSPTDSRPVTATKKVKNEKKENVSRFTPPKKEEAEQYFTEKGCLNSAMEADKFIDHFTSNGWKVGGKTAMKCWKASIRTWIARNGNNGQSSTNENRFA